MKPFYFLLISTFLSIGSYAQVKAGTIVRPRTVETTDSIVYYDVEITTTQKSYLNLLKGNWEIVSMKRQPRVEAEMLPNAILTISEDSSFAGNSGCNRIWGKFTLKGTGIKFGNLASTKMACPNMDQEAAFFKLLQQTISKYSVSEDKLYLQDGVGNIVFEARRK